LRKYIEKTIEKLEYAPPPFYYNQYEKHCLSNQYHSTLKPAKIASIKSTVMVIKLLKTQHQQTQAAHAQHFSKKVDPKFFVQTFLGGFNPRNPHLATGLRFLVKTNKQYR